MLTITQRHSHGEINQHLHDDGDPSFYGSDSGYVTVSGVRSTSDNEVMNFVLNAMDCTTASVEKRVGDTARVRYFSF